MTYWLPLSNSSSTHIFVWLEAAEALGKLNRGYARRVFNALIELSRNNDSTKQPTAIRILQDLRPVNNPDVITALEQLRSNALRLEWSGAVRALGELGAADRPKTLVTLVQSPRDPESLVRKAAADAVATMSRQGVRLFLRVRWFLPTLVTPRSVEELADR